MRSDNKRIGIRIIGGEDTIDLRKQAGKFFYRHCVQNRHCIEVQWKAKRQIALMGLLTVFSTVFDHGQNERCQKAVYVFFVNFRTCFYSCGDRRRTCDDNWNQKRVEFFRHRASKPLTILTLVRFYFYMGLKASHSCEKIAKFPSPSLVFRSSSRSDRANFAVKGTPLSRMNKTYTKWKQFLSFFSHTASIEHN